MKIIKIIIGLLMCIITLSSSYASNLYTNYANVDLITIRLHGAYTKGNATFSDLNLENTQSGFDVMLDTNIFYNINFLHNFYFGINEIANNGLYLDNNTLMGVASYNVLLSQLGVNINLGVGIGQINFISRAGSNCMDCNFHFHKTIAKQGFLNVGYFGKKFGYPNFGIYGGMKIIYSNYQENSYNGMVNKKYYNYLVGAGFMYKVSYLI